MGLVWERYLLILVCVVNNCLGQSDLCQNSTVSGLFHVTILTSKHYGANCDKTTPTGTANPIGDNIVEWASKTPPSLNIGLRVIDTCGSVNVNTKAICETLPLSRLTSGEESNGICSVGALPDSDAVITTTAIRGEDRLISAFAVADMPLLAAKDGYHQVEPLKTSVVQLGHSMTVVSQVIAKFMTELKWDFITVVYSNDSIGIESYQTFKAVAERYQICNQAQPWESSSPLNAIATRGVVYLGSEGTGYELFAEQYLANKVWITTLDVRGLTINNGRVYSVLRSEGDLLTNALAIFGEALTLAVDEEGCTSDPFLSCYKTQEFRRSLIRNTQIVRNRNLTYVIGDDGNVISSDLNSNTTYEVFQHGKEEKVATISLESGVVNMPGFEEEHSLCDPAKTECFTECGHLNNKYLYIHGDWTIVVSLPIHEEENPDDRWSCTKFTNTGLFRTEAARFTLNYLRSIRRATVNGKTFGMLVIDSCGDKLKTAGEVYDIIRGGKEICDRNGNCLDHKSVVAMISDYSSSVTQQIQTILRRVPLIQMAYGASSVALSDRTEHPYFLRTNPPDDLQAHFMVELLKRIDSKAGSTVSAVNILYTDGLYGRTGAEKVRQFLKKTNICIHMDKKVNESGGNDFNQLVEEILADTPEVRLIIVFMDSHHLSDLMDAINENRHRFVWLNRGYSFVFSDTWNDDKEFLESYGHIVKGSFSFKFNADFQSLTFGEYLTTRTLPTIEHENPWMSTLEQLVGNCKMPGNFLGTSSKLCTTPGKIVQYRNESYSLHLMKAITATVHGLRQFVSADIQSNHNVLFDLKTVAARYDSLLRMKISKYLEEGRSDRQPFTDRTPDSDTYGNGRVGYSIYNIDNNQKYVRVLQTGFKLSDTLGQFEAIPDYVQNGKVTDIMISKSNQDHCNNPAVGNTDKTSQAPDHLVIGMATLGAILFLTIIVLVVIAVRSCWGKRNQPQKETSDTEYSTYDHYLSRDQMVAIKNVAGPSPNDPNAFDDRYIAPTNQPVLGNDNHGYCPSISEHHPTVSRTHKPSDARSASGASQSTSNGDGKVEPKHSSGVPKPVPRSFSKDDGISTTHSQQSGNSSKGNFILNEITNV